MALYDYQIGVEALALKYIFVDILVRENVYFIVHGNNAVLFGSDLFTGLG